MTTTLVVGDPLRWIIMEYCHDATRPPSWTPFLYTDRYGHLRSIIDLDECNERIYCHVTTGNRMPAHRN